jgi:tRNA(Arg) A34 adenosine deaminase TadA
MTQAHERFMREAIHESIVHMRKGAGGPFGAVIAKAGRVVARGHNKVTSTNDPTAHAEVVAIRAACRKLKSFQLTGCTIYSSCEPCPMCWSAIHWAGIRTVYFGNTRRDAAGIGFDDELLYRELRTPNARRDIRMVPLLRGEALAAFNEWQRKKDKIRY